MTDDTNEAPKADPMAAARAAKARKAAAQAEAELQQSEELAASKSAGQPTISTLQGKAAPIFEGEPVEMRVTPWGHGQISTGGEFGFERFARGAVLMVPEQNARTLYNKRWAEPTDAKYADKFVKANERDAALAERRGARERQVLENGVSANETWRTGIDG